MTIAEIIASILLITGTLLVVTTAIAVWRAPDALTRVNLLGQTTGIALPLFIIAKTIVDFAENGFQWFVAVQVLLTLFGLWMIGAVGSYYMGRSIYGVTVTDVKHARREKRRQA